MIVKNEERFIINCLQHALPLVDEMIIVDTGSTDSTISLIKEFPFPIELRNFPWIDNFAAARNESIRGASGHWIMPLDADEVLTCDPQKLRDFLETAQQDAYIIPMNHHYTAEIFQFGKENIRLFRNVNVSYAGAIHEQLVGHKSVGLLEEQVAFIDHYGYTTDVVDAKEKRTRNSSILRSILKQNPKSTSTLFYLGREYKAAGDHATALRLILRTLPNLKDNFVLRTMALQDIVQCFINLQRNDECIHFVEALLTSNEFATPFFYYHLAGAYHNLHQYEKALLFYGKCLETTNGVQGGFYGLDSFYPKINMARICAINNIPSEAILWYLEAVFDKKNTRFVGKAEARDYFISQQRLDIVALFDQNLALLNPAGS
jgi:glycosyltransferase involved in cell wall biosynthesis